MSDIDKPNKSEQEGPPSTHDSLNEIYKEMATRYLKVSGDVDRAITDGVSNDWPAIRNRAVETIKRIRIWSDSLNEEERVQLPLLPNLLLFVERLEKELNQKIKP